MRKPTLIGWMGLVGLWLLVAFSAPLFAQSVTSGDVTGTVTDPSGAWISPTTRKPRRAW